MSPCGCGPSPRFSACCPDRCVAAGRQATRRAGREGTRALQPDGVGRDRGVVDPAAVGVARKSPAVPMGALPLLFVLVPGVLSGVAFYGSLVLGHPRSSSGRLSWRPRSFSSSFLDRGECGSSTDRLGGRGPGGGNGGVGDLLRRGAVSPRRSGRDPDHCEGPVRRFQYGQRHSSALCRRNSLGSHHEPSDRALDLG